jgi:hypothetical protein
MYMATNEERLEKYKKLNGKLQEIYASPAAGATMLVIYKSFITDTSKYKTYAEIVGDTILGFNKITDIPRLFQQKLGVSADESQRMVSQLIELLGPVVEREELEQTAKKEELLKLRATFSQTEGMRGQSEPEDTVEPIRTMAQDMSRVHGYGAYREELEKEEGAHQSSQTEVLRREEN